MAVPTYTHDLTDIDLAEASSTWQALGGGGAGIAPGPDFAMQGTNCIDKQITSANKGQVFASSVGISLGSNHVFQWIFMATPGQTNTIQNEGTVVVIGSTTGNYVSYHVEGNDTYGAAGRVGKCYPVRYLTTASTQSPYRTLYGTPSSSQAWVFGGKANITGSVKSANLGVDAMRYGTGAYLAAGASSDPATFSGFAAQNDTASNRWGILTTIGGAYELQGKFSIGQSSSGNPTGVWFEDSNAVISIVDTVHTSTDFTEFIIDGSTSTCYWTNVSVLSQGTNNPGKLTVNNSTTTSLDTCTFDSIGLSELHASVTASGCTWRSADAITQNTATISECTVANNTATSAIIADDLDNIVDCAFESTGSGHAIEIQSSGVYDFIGNTFTGYSSSDGSFGNEMIYNNSSGPVTINVSSGDYPSIRNGTGSSTTINNNVGVAVHVQDADTTAIENARVGIYTASSGGEVFNDLTGSSGNISTTATASLGVNIYIRKSSSSGTRYVQYSTPANTGTGGLSLTAVLQEDDIAEA